MFAKTTLAFTLAAAVANAHMLMSNPVPYGAASLNNGPLDASGSDFPCKQRSGVYEKGGASNVYEQGSTQTLKFKGGATHGGGSCQVSVTTDLEPNKNSVWKVIHSIEGGCPAKGAAGNIGNDANADAPDTYDFTIPENLPAGEYSLAWTWFNKIGNREMYMNCAPVTITGSEGSTSALAGLPDMFVANIGNGCSVAEGSDVQFPNPGNSVAKENGATDVFAAPQGACATGSSQPGPVESAAPEAPEAPEPTKAPEPENPGGVFVPVDPTTSAAAPAQPTEAPAQPEQPEEPTKPEQPTTPPTAPVTGGKTGACDQEGAWNCVGGKAFQRCASGTWSSLMQVADGTSCKEGESDTLSMNTKRTFSFMRRALRMGA
jgi:hypothetical protein